MNKRALQKKEALFKKINEKKVLLGISRKQLSGYSGVAFSTIQRWYEGKWYQAKEENLKAVLTALDRKEHIINAYIQESRKKKI